MSGALFAEFVDMVANVRQRDFDILEAAGVPGAFLWHGPSRFGVAIVAPDAGGTYQLSEGGGELAIVVPARPLAFDDHDVGDLVAFYLSRPSRWWTRLGAVPLLSPDAILRAEVTRTPLRVFSTPLDWLRAGGDGIVILDWQVNLRFHLGGVGRVNADTRRLGDAIDRRLREPTPRPEIYVRRAA